MLSERVTLAPKLLFGFLPICYGGLLLIALPNTKVWLMLAAVVLVVLLVLLISVDVPLQTSWPVFPGVFLVLVSSIDLSQGAPIFPGVFLVLVSSIDLSQGAPIQGPITRTSAELLGAYLPAALYILWGLYATWKSKAVM